MHKLIIGGLLTLSATLTNAAPIADTKGVELREALRDSKACWVSSWGDTETVYWSRGLSQKKVAEVIDQEKVGDKITAIMKHCYEAE